MLAYILVAAVRYQAILLHYHRVNRGRDNLLVLQIWEDKHGWRVIRARPVLLVRI